MSNESIERFRAGELVEVPIRHPEGQWVRYSDHERIVKELEEAHRQKMINLEAAAAYDAGNARAAIKKWDQLRAQPSLSDAIKKVERYADEWEMAAKRFDGQKQTTAAYGASSRAMAARDLAQRLKSLGTQREGDQS